MISPHAAFDFGYAPGMAQTVRQVELVRAGGATVIVWVDAALALRPGVEVTGKDGVRWTVRTVYRQVLEPHLLNRGWAVGGLL